MSNTYKYKSHRGLELAVYAEQERLIREKCGQEAADKANYGWGVGGGDNSVSVATKVYGFGVLQTDASLGDCKKDFQHSYDWDEDNEACEEAEKAAAEEDSAE
jgi:hypothetical protein